MKLLALFQIARATHMEEFEDEVFDYFEEHMAKNIISLQSSSENPLPVQVLESSPIKSLDELGKEIVKCCKGLQMQKVINYINCTETLQG